MIEVSQLILLVLVETTIGLLILSGVLLFFTLRRKGRIREAAHHLAQRVQGDKPARGERLKTLLQEKYGYEGKELDQAVHDITQAEMRLFQNLINGYIKDDQVHLQQVDVDEENLVLAYQELKAPAGASAPVQEVEAGEGADEMVRLQEENQRLSDELRVTMDTMGRMLNEYSSMFAGGSDTPLSRAEAEEAEEDTPAAETETVADADDLEVAPMDSELASPQPDASMDLPDELYDGGPEQASALDDEVSEIIDEVMEIADEMDQVGGTETASEQKQDAIAESLMDDLEQVDIEIPEMIPAEDPIEAGDINIPEPEIASEPVSDVIPDFEPVPASASDSEPEPESEIRAESELDALLDAVPEPTPEPKLEDEIEPEAEDESVLEAESELDALLDAVPDEASEPEPKLGSEDEPELGTGSDLDSLLGEVPEAESGSLEEEWAKLLEEDAESKQDPKTN